MEVKRTHDKFYLGEDYKTNPKEYYKFVKKVLEEERGYTSDSEFELLDIGCETGSFLYYLRNNFPHAKLTGMDVMGDLLERVNDGIEDNQITTILADVSQRETLPKKQYDIVTLLGVLSIFDDFTDVLDNILDNLVTWEGGLYIFGMFNPYDIDVLVKVKNAEQENNVWESGWNYISKCSIEKYCQKKGVQCEFEEFQLEIDIPKHEDDPLRTWTEDMADGTKMVINGIQLVHHFYLCKIRKQK